MPSSRARSDSGRNLAAAGCRPLRPGMTLIELAVAIAVSGVILLAARAVFEQVADGAERLASAALAHDREMNGETLLRDLLAGVEHRAETGPHWEGLDGDEAGVRFSSRCVVPGGWTEPCRAELSIEAGRVDQLPASVSESPSRLPSAASLVVSVTTRNVRSSYDGLLLPSHGWFLYLETASGGGVWRRSWSATQHPPLAIGVVVPGDTLVLRVGSGS